MAHRTRVTWSVDLFVWKVLGRRPLVVAPNSLDCAASTFDAVYRERRWSCHYCVDMIRDDAVGPARPKTPIESFLAQPDLRAEEDSPELVVASQDTAQFSGNTWQRFRHRVTLFMFEKQPGRYSSIAPRTPDGKRTKIFPFNGNGRGR